MAAFKIPAKKKQPGSLWGRKRMKQSYKEKTEKPAAPKQKEKHLCNARGCQKEAVRKFPYKDKFCYYCEKHYSEFYRKWKAGEKRALIE